MDAVQMPSCQIFQALRNGEFDLLVSLAQNESAVSLRPFLLYLVRSTIFSGARKEHHDLVIGLLSGLGVVNGVVSGLTVDFGQLSGDITKFRRLGKAEADVGGNDSLIVTSLQRPLTVEFERGDFARRLRLLVREILRMHSEVGKNNALLTPFFLSSLLQSHASIQEIKFMQEQEDKANRYFQNYIGRI